MKTIKSALLAIGISLLMAGIASADALIATDLVQADAGGGALLSVSAGEDLVGTFLPGRTRWPAVAETLSAYSGSASDYFWLEVKGLNASWKDQTKKVMILATTPRRLPGTWIRVNSATVLDTVNVGVVRLYNSGSGAPTDTTQIRAQIEPRQGATSWGKFTVPAGPEMLIRSWRMTATTTAVFSGAASTSLLGPVWKDSLSSGVAAILVREPGRPWTVWDEIAFRADQGPAFMVTNGYPAIPEKSDVVVRAAVTGSASWLTGRVDYGLK